MSDRSNDASNNHNVDSSLEDHHHHHGEPSSTLGSPSQMSNSLHTGFSPEDIQELLGGVLEDHPHHDHHCDHQEGGIPNDAKAAARSERKRSREKQRRSDVNKQFATLTDSLRQIEGQNKDLFAAPIWTEASFSPTNRVELIARTIHVLQALDRSHKKQKTRVQELEQELERAKKAGEEAAAKAKEKMMGPMQAGQNQVVMMVPMLLPSCGTAGGATAATPGAAAPPTAAVAQPHMAFMPTLQDGGNGGEGGASMPTMPWMMPHPMWGMQMPTAPGAMAMAPTVPTAVATEESKQPPASERTTTSNLAHCA